MCSGSNPPLALIDVSILGLWGLLVLGLGIYLGYMKNMLLLTQTTIMTNEVDMYKSYKAITALTLSTLELAQMVTINVLSTGITTLLP